MEYGAITNRDKVYLTKGVYSSNIMITNFTKHLKFWIYRKINEQREPI